MAVGVGGNSGCIWIASQSAAKFLSTFPQKFPAASALGGTLLNLPLLVSSALAPGELVLLDAAGIAADAGPIEVKASAQCDIEMADTPRSDATTGTGALSVRCSRPTAPQSWRPFSLAANCYAATPFAKSSTWGGYRVTERDQREMPPEIPRGGAETVTADAGPHPRGRRGDGCSNSCSFVNASGTGAAAGTWKGRRGGSQESYGAAICFDPVRDGTARRPTRQRPGD